VQLSNQVTEVERVTRNLVVVGSIPTWRSFVMGLVKNDINRLKKDPISRIYLIITLNLKLYAVTPYMPSGIALVDALKQKFSDFLNRNGIKNNILIVV